jgi:hypothetical protein
MANLFFHSKIWAGIVYSVLTVALFTGAFFLAAEEIAQANVVQGSACGGTTDHAAWNNRQQLRYANGWWCISTPTARLIFQHDGNLVAYTGAHSGGRVLWASGTNNSGQELRFQPDGNVVVYGCCGIPVWDFRTSVRRTGTYRLFVSTRYLQETFNNANLKVIYF